MWPALRQNFSWCPGALQPRSLDDRMLDLQFAPASAYPRFHKIPRENVIGAERKSVEREPWCAPCADWLFRGLEPSPVERELQALGPILGDDPTLMRHLFLARELTDKLDGSPTAGAALLDVAEALAPQPEQAVDYKREAASQAVFSAEKARAEEALKCLFLVS